MNDFSHFFFVSMKTDVFGLFSYEPLALAGSLTRDLFSVYVNYISYRRLGTGFQFLMGNDVFRLPLSLKRRFHF